MQSVVAALEQHQAKARAALNPNLGGGKEEGEAAFLGELQELAERMACTAVDAHKDHPIGFRRYN